MKKTLFLAWVLLHAVMINAQDLINKPEKKISCGISTGVMFFPSAFDAPAMGYESPIRNFFYEPNLVLPVVEFFFNKRENFHHSVGGSFSYSKVRVGYDEPTTYNTYKGIYLYYQNQLLFRKYIKGWLIKNLYVGGRFIAIGRDMIYYQMLKSGSFGNERSTDKNIIWATGISFGYIKIWNKFYLDLGINRSVLAAGIGERVRHPNSSIKDEYSALMTPFDDSYLVLFGGEPRSLTYFIKIGYKIK